MSGLSRARPLLLFRSAEHACSYLPGRAARTGFLDPRARMDMATYAQLAARGFRRSGEHVYRPSCNDCTACIPLRVPVADFQPNRTQRRTWERNRDLHITELHPEYDEEHFQLYRRYLRSRHPAGGMDETDPESYMGFLTSPWSDTRLHEFRLDGRLAAVAVTDRFPDALSAVYTFFDPQLGSRSLGTYAALSQIRRARELDLRWLYLGYWVRECRKMNYKDRFRPVEAHRGEAWIRFERGDAIA